MTNYIQSQFVELNKEYETYIQYLANLEEWNKLPWHRKMFGTKPIKVKHYSYKCIPLSGDYNYSIQLRLSFFNTDKEIAFAVAEEDLMGSTDSKNL